MLNQASAAASRLAAHREQSGCEIGPLELHQINEHYSQQSATDDSAQETTFPDEKCGLMGGNKEFPPALPDPEKYRVEFDGLEDPTHPHNWDFTTKFRILFPLLLF